MLKENKTVLILEDEPDAGMLISAILESHEFSPTLVTTVSEGKKLLSNSATRDFDLLFLDYSLPDGNSFEIINHKELVRDIPIILCSAYLDSDQKKDAQEKGVLECLNKPINSEAIKDALYKHELVNE